MARLAEGAAREIILAHARDLFLAHGAGHVTFRKISKAVGVTPMALYRHFESKEDLLIQLLQQGFRTFDEYLSRSEAGRTGAERLALLTEGFFDFALEQGAYFELIFLTGQTPEGLRDRKEVRKVARPTFLRLVECVQDCVDEGVLADRDARSMAVTLLAHSTGLAALHRSGTFRWSRAEARRTFEASIGSVLDGYRSERAA